MSELVPIHRARLRIRKGKAAGTAILQFRFRLATTPNSSKTRSFRISPIYPADNVVPPSSRKKGMVQLLTRRVDSG